MVKLRQYSGGSEEQTMTCNTSCSSEVSPDALKLNGNTLKTVVINGNYTDKVPSKEISFARNHNEVPANTTALVNGNSKEVPANTTALVNGNSEVPAKKTSLVNGKSINKVIAKEVSSINRNSINKVPAKEVSSINGNSINEALVSEVPINPNGNCEVPTEKVAMVNGKNNDDTSSGSYLNDLNTQSSKNGSFSNVHTSDSLCNEDNSDENEQGFIEVVHKRRRNRNYHKPISNLPTKSSTKSIRRDNGNDKNYGEKTTPTHLCQKPPSRNFAPIRSSYKSYSSVLVNGSKKISQLRNGGPNISTNIQNIVNCNQSPKSVGNTDLPGIGISVDQLSVSCKQCNSSTKVEVNHVSAQTDVSSQNEQSSNENIQFLQSHESMIPLSEKTNSQSDYVDVGEISDVSSNAAYCDSVDIKQDDGDSSNVDNHGIKQGGGECSKLENHDIKQGDGESSKVDDVSNDSGRGDSEITYDESMPYCCEFPREKTSQLIGKGGSFKYEIERKSGVKLWVYPHEFDKSLSIICMIGTGAQIEKAKEIIKERFRHASLKQWLGFNPINPPLSEKYLPILPEGTDFMGVVSCICDPNFFWVQQYGHPHLYSLEDLERRISDHFNTVTDAPGIDNPTIGSVIAVPGVRDGDNVKWIRGWVINIIPEDEKVVVRYLDHGGDHLVPVSNIRPMRHDFFSMPFFAAQCCLYDILPTGGVWSDEARAEFTRICNSSTCPPIVRVVCRTPECYYVTMFGYDSEINAQVDIASHLVTKGFGVRPCFPATEFPSEIQQ